MERFHAKNVFHVRFMMQYIGKNKKTGNETRKILHYLYHFGIMCK